MSGARSRTTLICDRSAGRLDDADRIEAGAVRDKRCLPARWSIEDEEADLVLRYVDRTFEPDARRVLRQLESGRVCPPLAGGALPRVAATEVGLDEVARHGLDAMSQPARRKRQNI